MKKLKKGLDELSPEDFLYNRNGPWPQPSPAHPLGEAAAVLHIPIREWADWWLHIGSRYALSLVLTPFDYLNGILSPGLKPVSDDEFNNYLTNSMMSKFIVDKFDEKDREIFKGYDVDSGKYRLIDLEAVKVVKTFEGIYASGTKTLLENQDGKWKAIDIWMDKTESHIQPEDGDSWELAKYFVLQGGALCATLVVHPLIHFPLDAVNAITKTAVPKKHILFKLLYPHLRFTLPLENAVLNFKSSLLQAQWWMSYAPYPGEAKGLRDLLVEGYKGIKGNVSYPNYEYPLEPWPVLSEYGTFQDAYYTVVLDYVREILSEVPKDDPIVISWAEFISREVPGFPNGEEIFKGDTFVKTVASYFWMITVGHSVDHYNYGKMDVRKVPLRVRQKPPKKGNRMISRKKLNKFWDIGKYLMARRLFFKATTVTSLLDTIYEFNEDKHKNAAKKFKEDLRRVDREMKEKGICFIPLEEIAASIQF